MNNENMPVITDREELYDKCENMEQLFDKYYLPLLYKHYSKVYQLQQENKILKENAEHNDKVVDKVNWENQLLKKENEQLKNNWNELKKWLRIKDIVANSKINPQSIKFKDLLKHMEYLEKSDNNVEETKHNFTNLCIVNKVQPEETSR